MLNTHGKAAAMGTGAVLSTAAEQRCMLQTYHRRRIEKGIAPGGCCHELSSGTEHSRGHMLATAISAVQGRHLQHTWRLQP